MSTEEQPAPAPGRRPRSTWVVPLVVLICLVGAYLRQQDDDKPAPRPVATTHTITLQVTVETLAQVALADVTYGVAGSQSQERGRRTPWVKTLSGRAGTVVALVAQNQASGRITCSISVDSVEVRTATSTGEFAVVSCSAAVA